MIMDITGKIGTKTVTVIGNITYFWQFCIEVMANIFTFAKNIRIASLVLMRQILFTGFDALALVSFGGFIIGSVIILQGSAIFPNLANSQLMFTILVSVVTRELANFIPALILIARSGTAMTTELGNMVINNEVDALVSMNISPISYLVVPRTIAMVFSLVPLGIYFNIISLFAAGIVSQFLLNVNLADFSIKLFSQLTFLDVFISVIKSVSFAFAIAIISCYHGLKIDFARTEVPQRTSKAVVHSISAVIFLEILITIVSLQY